MLITQSVLPKFFIIDLGLWFSAHICPQVVYPSPLWACPWRYWKRLHFYFHEAWKFLPPPFRNVIVRSFQYKEVLLGASNSLRSVYWWRLLTEATRGCLDRGPLCRAVCTNGLLLTTACWRPYTAALCLREGLEDSFSFVTFERMHRHFQGSLSKLNITFPLKMNSYSRASENLEGLVLFILKSKKS